MKSKLKGRPPPQPSPKEGGNQAIPGVPATEGPAPNTFFESIGQPSLKIGDTTVLRSGSLEIGGVTYSVSLPDYALTGNPDAELSDGSEKTSSSSGSDRTRSVESPPTSVQHSPSPSISSVSGISLTGKAAKGKVAADELESFSSAAMNLTETEKSPASLINFLVSPECTFTAHEKSKAYRALLNASIMAYDPDTGTSRFAWAFERLSSMDNRARAAALLHTENTIASFCKAFFDLLEDAEETESLAEALISGDSGTAANAHSLDAKKLVNTQLLGRVLDHERSHLSGRQDQIEAKLMGEINSLRALTNAKLSPIPSHTSLTSRAEGEVVDAAAAVTIPMKGKNKTDVEKLREAVAQKTAEAQNRKRELEVQKTETQNAVNRITSLNKEIEKLKVDRARQETKASKKAKAKADNEASDMKSRLDEAEAKLLRVNEDMRIMKEKSDATLKIMENMKLEHDSEIADLNLRLQAAESDIIRMNGEVEFARDEAATQKNKLEAVEVTLGLTERELQREKGNLAMIRNSMAGDTEAMNCVKLRAILDKMKLDLCTIAEIINLEKKRFAGPIEYHASKNGLSIMEASMQIFCIAARKVEAIMKFGSPYKRKKHMGYAKLFETVNFHPSFDLIFSDASELRHIANKHAHLLPTITSIAEVEKLIDDACPKDEERTAKICFVALEMFRPLKERASYQTKINADSKTGLLERKQSKERGDRWKALNEWLLKESGKTLVIGAGGTVTGPDTTSVGVTGSKRGATGSGTGTDTGTGPSNPFSLLAEVGTLYDADEEVGHEKEGYEDGNGEEEEGEYEEREVEEDAGERKEEPVGGRDE